MDIRRTLFGDLQYQISKPKQNPEDLYWYQRVRQIYRDGRIQDEWIIRSANPGDEAGLADPERGFENLYSLGVFSSDLFHMLWNALSLGKNPFAAGLLGQALNSFLDHTANGVQYPSALPADIGIGLEIAFAAPGTPHIVATQRAALSSSTRGAGRCDPCP